MRNFRKTLAMLLFGCVFYSSGNLKFINLNYVDKRMDLIVAFRVVGRETNGSVTILWKELNRLDAPKILFAKNEKLSDLTP